MFWKPVEPLLEKIDLQYNPENEPVTVKFLPPPLELVGVGTDAVVVRHPEFPDIAFKVYARERMEAKEDEYRAYQQLAGSPSFAVCHGAGERYLVLSYEEGMTLYECLVEGVTIPENVVDEVEEARQYARSVGLNPRDIHLKNVLLQDGHAKLIDVSEYVKPGNDGRWDHLVQAYHLFYPYIAGKKIPVWMLEMVKRAYYVQQGTGDFSVQEFGRQLLKALLKKWTKN
jgi:hypothetical protein